MKKILSTLVISVVLLSVVVPVSVFAIDINTNYVPLTDVPGFADATSAKNPGGILKTLFNLSIGIGGILAVIMLIFAGFKYMYEESIFGKGKAREQITNAFFGLLLILGSYIILRTINSDLLRINLLLPQGDVTALRGLLAQQKAFENKLDSAIKSAEVALNKARDLRNQIATADTEISTLKTKIGTSTVGFDVERKRLVELEQQKNTLSNQELYVRAVEDPNLAITRAETEVLGERSASGATIATNVAATLSSAQRNTNSAIQTLEASDPNKTNTVTQKQIADLKAKKIVLDSSSEQLLAIEAYNTRNKAVQAAMSSSGDGLGYDASQIPDSKYTKPADLYRAIVSSGATNAQKLKDAGYLEEAKKLLADSIVRAKTVCSDNCGY